MDQLDPSHHAAVTFTEAELAGLDAAIADADARGTIPNEDVTAWLDSLETSSPLPEPQPRKA